jgi:hypothetical protein
MICPWLSMILRQFFFKKERYRKADGLSIHCHRHSTYQPPTLLTHIIYFLKRWPFCVAGKPIFAEHKYWTKIYIFKFRHCFTLRLPK